MSRLSNFLVPLLALYGWAMLTHVAAGFWGLWVWRVSTALLALGFVGFKVLWRLLFDGVITLSSDDVER